MSLWDVLFIVIILVAIFRGYFKGLCRRLNEWVGFILAGILAYFNIGNIDNFIFSHFRVDGRQHLERWLQDFFTTRMASNPSNQLETLKQWIADLFLPSQLKESLYATIKNSSDQIYSSVYGQVARVLSDPLWDMVLFIFGTIVIFTILLIVGEVGGLLVKKLYFTMVLDRFLGAILSGFIMVIAAGFFTALCIFVIPESAGALGHILHNSFLAPMLQEAVDSILQGGLIR